MNLLRDSLMASLRTGKLLKIFKKPSEKSPRIFMTTEKNKDQIIPRGYSRGCPSWPALLWWGSMPSMQCWGTQRCQGTSRVKWRQSAWHQDWNWNGTWFPRLIWLGLFLTSLAKQELQEPKWQTKLLLEIH